MGIAVLKIKFKKYSDFIIIGYGKAAERVHNRKRHVVTDDSTKILKLMRKPLFESSIAIDHEGEEAECAELQLKKSRVLDDKPVHLSVAILQYSKLYMLQLMTFLEDHLTEGSFRPLYSDTDSMALATTKTITLEVGDNNNDKVNKIFGPLIKPDMMQSWKANYKSLFVTTERVEDLRQPGLLKLEFQQADGDFIALAPKTYLAVSSSSRKEATKGLPLSLSITREVFLTLFN